MNSTDIKDRPMFGRDAFGYSLEEFIFALHEEQELEADDYPVEVHYAKKRHGHVICAEDLCRRFFEDFWLDKEKKRFWAPSAEYFSDYVVAEDFIENTYEFSDVDPWPNTDELHGLKRLTDLIDWFLFWNWPIYRLLGDFEWFKPEQHCIGVEVLQGALETFERVNRDKHFTYTEGSESALITWEFVKDYVREVEE
ncbi:MAG: hypothetical protein AAGA75_21755 [Cyanobacteria bacterium P01_E01_bin.6]